jgi:hypothetical protein
MGLLECILLFHGRLPGNRQNLIFFYRQTLRLRSVIGGSSKVRMSPNLAHFAHLNWPTCTSQDVKIRGWTGGKKWNYSK